MTHQLSRLLAVATAAGILILLLRSKAATAATCGCSSSQQMAMFGVSTDNGSTAQNPTTGPQSRKLDTARIETEVLIPKEEFERAASPGNGRQSSSPSSYINCRSPWPNGILRYRFHSSYPSAYKSSIRQYIASLKSRIDYVVSFIEGDYFTGQSHVTITDGIGCTSYVGMRYLYSSQDLSISVSDGCVTEASIHTLFLYALGFSHEHVRSDRDNYINIRWYNVRSDKCSNFYKDSYLIPSDFPSYDYSSIRHYSSSAFTCNTGSPTITKKDGSSTLSVTTTLSSLDVAKVKYVYSSSNLAYCYGSDSGSGPASLSIGGCAKFVWIISALLVLFPPSNY